MMRTQASDKEVLDQILKEKGITREQLSKRIQDEQQAERERIEKEKAEAIERERLAQEKELNERLLRAYNQHMVAMVDDHVLPSTVGDLRELLCPHCGGPLPFIRDCVRVLDDDRIHRFPRPAPIAGSNTELSCALPMLKGDFECNCGKSLHLVVETGSPVSKA